MKFLRPNRFNRKVVEGLGFFTGLLAGSAVLLAIIYLATGLLFGLWNSFSPILNLDPINMHQAFGLLILVFTGLTLAYVLDPIRRKQRGNTGKVNKT